MIDIEKGTSVPDRVRVQSALSVVQVMIGVRESDLRADHQHRNAALLDATEAALGLVVMISSRSADDQPVSFSSWVAT